MITFVTPAAPPWRQCHASTVAVAGTELLVAFFAGTAEGSSDTRIHLARGTGETWDDSTVLSQQPGPRWNPVLGYGPDRALYLFSKVGTPISAWRTVVRRSIDDGHNWDDERDVVPHDSGGRGPVRTPPIILEDGAWVAGASVESPDGVWDPFVDISVDDGRTWSRRDIPLDHRACRGGGAIQPSLWEAGSRVTALMRTTAGYAWRASSVDGGRTWSAAHQTDLPNNNSGLAAVQLQDGRVVCVHNASGEDWGPRNHLVWSTSVDDGRTWSRGGTIDRLPPSGDSIVGRDWGVMTTGMSELSYPTIITAGDVLLVSYTWRRRRIALATLEIEHL